MVDQCDGTSNKSYSTGVGEGVDVLEVPIKGCPITTMKVSVKWGNKENMYLMRKHVNICVQTISN